MTTQQPEEESALTSALNKVTGIDVKQNIFNEVIDEKTEEKDYKVDEYF